MESTRKNLIHSRDELLAVLKRLRAANDNLAYRTFGGLRVMIRNDPVDVEDSGTYINFDVSIVTEDELPAIAKAVNNEMDIMPDDAGCVVIEEYSFLETDGEGLKEAMDFLNVVNHWTVCQCGEYLIKDEGAMCYYCHLTNDPSESSEDVFCPICHEESRPRWMIATSCCKRQMHRKCKEACIAASAQSAFPQAPSCPLCRTAW